MKGLLNISLLFSLLIIGCTVEPPGPKESAASKGLSLITKGSELEGAYHYWYQGESIPLTPNLEYVNILLSNPDMNETEFDAMCQEMHLQAFKEPYEGGLVKVCLEERPNSLDQYDIQTHAMRKDPRINGVYPFFEQGAAEPIGTSNVFYLKLKGEGVYDPEPMQQMAEEYGVTIVKEVPYMPDWYILSIEGSSFENSLDATNAFYESDLFADVDPAFMFNFQPCTVNDPYYSLQWGLNNTTYPDYDINVEGAWEIASGLGVTIAIVDKGVDSSHPDLAANMHPLSYDAKNQIIPSTVTSVHGTHVAGIAGAITNNNAYVAGVAYNAKIMNISHPMLPSDTISSEYASGITFAWQNGAGVINCCWGRFDDPDGSNYLRTTILENAIVNAMTFGRNGLGSVVVCASGNTDDNSMTITYPAKFDDRILTVGSIGSGGYRMWGSGYGYKLDVVAPGEDVWSTIPESGVWQFSGTSMATPHASGVAALILSANPNLKREEVVRIIEMTAKKISPGGVYAYYSYQDRYNGTWNQELGYGLIDATAAVSYAWFSNQIPPSGSPSLEYYIPTGGIPYNDGTIVIPGIYNYYPYCATGCFSIPDSYTNSAYTYFWHFSTSGDPYWYPSFNFVGNNSGVEMSIPRPSVNSVLSISCEVFNGPTHVFTAHRNFDIWNDFPS